MGGAVETVIGTITGAAAWMASVEWRLKGKVSKDRFADQQIQLKRLESHIWDIMRAGNVKATIEPPDEIKNNNKEMT